MRATIFAALLFALMPLLAAQPPEQSEVQNVSEDAALAAGQQDASSGAASDESLEGDVVLLKNGRMLRGVRVVRVTPAMVELEYIPGQETMKMPRKQVAEIQYGQTASQTEHDSGKAGGIAPDVMLGEELSSEFHRKITAPVPDAPLKYENQDLMEILQDLARRIQVEIVFEESVLRMPPADRRVSVTLPAGTAVTTFVRREFREAVPFVKIYYEYEKIHVAPADVPIPPPPRGTAQ